jgi:hypothetical protein
MSQTITKSNFNYIDKSTGFTVFSGKNSLDLCITEGRKLNHELFLAMDSFYGDKIKLTKQYVSFPSVDTLWNVCKHHKHSDPTNGLPLYEVIPHAAKCNLFADLEWSTKWKSVDEIKTLITDLLSNHSLLKNKKLKIRFLNASLGEKGSLHIHCNKYHFETIETQQRFWNEIYVTLTQDSQMWFIDDTGKSYVRKTFIDFGVYNKNRMIRTIYSTKMKIGGICVRPLLPDEPLTDVNKINNYIITKIHPDSEILDCSGLSRDIQCAKKNIWSKPLIQHFLDKHNIDVTIENLEGDYIRLRNKTAIRKCTICDADHTDNALLTIDKGVVTFRCHFDKTKGRTKVIGRMKDTIEVEHKIPFMRYMEESYKNTTIEEFRIWETRVLGDFNNYCSEIKSTAKPYVMYKDEYHDDHDDDRLYSIYRAKSLDNFHSLFSQYKVFVNFKEGRPFGKKKAITELWKDWLYHDVKEGETCIPGNNSIYKINTFQELAITENIAFEKEDLLKDIEAENFFDFYKKAACENEEQYQFLIKFLAHIIQKPGIQTKTCIVLRGNEGTGKGVLANMMRSIVGRHNFYSPQSFDKIAGKFNSIIIGKLVIFLDEMTWGGNMQHVDGIFKKLITEDQIDTEEKNLCGRVSDNISNVIISSNESHVIPASNSCRRIVVFEVNDYFKTLPKIEQKRIYGIDVKAIARFLYKVDISEFEPSHEDNRPNGEGLALQKMHSLTPIQKWYANILSNYNDTRTDTGFYPIFFGGGFFRKQNVYDSYCAAVKTHQVITSVLWRQLKKMGFHPILDRKPTIEGARIVEITVPNIRDCVEAFNKFIGCTVVEID